MGFAKDVGLSDLLLRGKWSAVIPLASANHRLGLAVDAVLAR